MASLFLALLHGTAECRGTIAVSGTTGLLHGSMAYRECFIFRIIYKFFHSEKLWNALCHHFIFHKAVFLLDSGIYCSFAAVCVSKLILIKCTNSTGVGKMINYFIDCMDKCIWTHLLSGFGLLISSEGQHECFIISSHFG